MILLQTLAGTSSYWTNYVMLFGTLGMVSLTLGIVFFVIFHQRKVTRFNTALKKMEDEKQQILLNASIKFQEEERNRIAADLHDDVGPLLATARLYLNENLINQEQAAQLQSIYTAKQIIDDAIQIIRNIPRSISKLTPLTALSSILGLRSITRLSHGAETSKVLARSVARTKGCVALLLFMLHLPLHAASRRRGCCLPSANWGDAEHICQTSWCSVD